MSFKVKVANLLKSSAFGRWIYPVVQNTYRAYAIPMRRRRLQKHGWETLAKLNQVFVDNHIPYFFDYGTLLGLIREKGFIKHDDDIDLTILPETFTPRNVYEILTQNGFRFLHGFKIGSQIVEFTVVDDNDLTADIFFPRKDKNGKMYGIDIYWDPEQAYPSELANSVVETAYTTPATLTTIMVNTVSVSVPQDYEKLLIEEFGSTWNIPDAKFVARDTIPCRKLDVFAIRITEAELKNSK